MRKDTTTPTDAATLDTIKAADADHMRTDAQEPPTTSGRPAQETSPADLQTITPATSGHIEAQEPCKEGKKRKSTTSSTTKRKYNKSAYDTLQITIAKGAKEAIHAAAANHGLSTAAYITAAINAYEQREVIPPLASNPYINK